MSLMLRQILWIKTIDIKKKDIVKLILIKVKLLMKTLRNIEKHDNRMLFQNTRIFLYQKVRNPLSL